MQWLLLISVLVIATCGIIYELIAGTLASYLLGDSVTQFSTIIGTYLFSMGIGSWLAKYIKKNLVHKFVIIEIIIGLIGGCSSLFLFFIFNQVEQFRVLLYFTVSVTGVLVGAEIPLVMRMLQGRIEFSELISRVFSFDYIGALVASVVFPIWLVPQLGLEKTSLFFGILNIIVALVAMYKLMPNKGSAGLKLAGFAALFTLVILFAFSHKITRNIEKEHYGERIIISKSSPYQRIILTESGGNLRLFLNGNLQFSTKDEYRYHEALVHPAAQMAGEINNVLVLGGGDGMALRELLKYPDISNILLVDLDAAMTDLFTHNPRLRALNNGSFKNPRVQVRNEDAFRFLRENKAVFDLIIVDFPDPSNFSIGKLYTNTFYSELKKHISDSGTAVIQCTSPWAAPQSFWCIDNTLRSINLNTLPYHTLVPSFGDWGFIIASKQKQLKFKRSLPANLKYLDSSIFATMLNFPRDIGSRPTEVNNLQNQILVAYFEEEWKKVQ